MAGTESVWADDPGILGIPRSRQTVASIYPQYVPDSQDFPSALRTGLDRSVSVATPSPGQCSARAAQDIWEHHRPAVGSSMRALCGRTQHLREATLDGSRETHRARGPRGAVGDGPRPAPNTPRDADRGTSPTGCEPQASGRQMSHSLSESTRQITPPIRSGHAPPSTGSRKSSQSVHPGCVRTW